MELVLLMGKAHDGGPLSQALYQRKPVSGYKLKDITRGGIFVPGGENGVEKTDTATNTLSNPTGIWMYQVGDFGLSRIKHNTFASGGVRGTLPWMAPKLLNGSSVWLYEKEILTEDEPYTDMHCGAIIGGMVSNMLRPPIPEFCDRRWKCLMEECWSHDPDNKPTFTEVTNKINAMSIALHSK